MTQITDVAALRALLGKPHKLTASKIYDHVNPQAAELISRSTLLMMATSGTDGATTVSPKGDPAGFVKVKDKNTLLLPERPGNKLLHSFENLLQNPQLGVIFMVPGCDETLRVNGQARLLNDPALNEQFTVQKKPALLVIEITVQQSFFHCAKAFKRSKAWQPEHWPAPMKVSMGEEIANAAAANKIARKALSAAVNSAVKSNYKNDLY